MLAPPGGDRVKTFIELEGGLMAFDLLYMDASSLDNVHVNIGLGGQHLS